MKKLISIFLVIGLLTISVFAIDLSIGSDFDFTYELQSSKLSKGDSWGKYNEGTKLLGFNVFFDAQYLRLGVGSSFSIGDINTKIAGNGLGHEISKKDKISDVDLINVGISILGKFPFKLGEKSRIYPILGFDFDVNVSAKVKGKELRKELNEDNIKDLSHYYVMTGVGMDLFIGDHFFITPKTLIGLDMKPQKTKSESLDIPTLLGGKYTSNRVKFDVGIGFGYKF